MNNTILYTVISLSATGLLAAIILYFISRMFKVEEDPRIDDIQEVLPGANCGGCGYPGCRGFAEAIVKADDLSTLYCPVGGNNCMADVARILGKEVIKKEPMVAVVKCSGTFEYRKKTNVYDSSKSCAISSCQYGGDTGCVYGCLGLGDCVSACKFDAIYIDENTGLPVINEEKCTGCAACVTACPKNVIELRKKGPKGRRIFVSCGNKEKGGTALKSCSVACIGCGKCVKECKFDAITVVNFLAYIDFEKCKLCRKCVDVCPTKAIHEINFPLKKKIEQSEAKEEKNEEE